MLYTIYWLNYDELNTISELSDMADTLLYMNALKSIYSVIANKFVKIK